MNMITLATLISSPGAVSVESAFGGDLIQMIVNAGLVVRFVLLLLLFLSVVSWTIIFVKWRMLRKAKQETEFFLDLFWGNTEFNKINNECADLIFSPITHLFRAGYSELKKMSRVGSSSLDPNIPGPPLLETVERSLKRTSMNQGRKLEKALSFLATTGNTAPFIGLFGTVWGIMESFRGIGMKGSASLAVVAPGISEALVATAAGLAAAIPAVIAFNFFNSKVRVLKSEMEIFSSEFLSLVERHLHKRQANAQQE